MNKYGKDTVELELAIFSSNAAFIGHDEDGKQDPTFAAREVARILREIADDIEVGTVYCGGNIRDMNGNRVGSFNYEFSADDEEDDE